MKAARVIADALSEWRPVRHAPDLAHELFDRLSAEEQQRLAVAGFAAEIRKALTRKSRGVPDYSSVDVVDKASGEITRQYKQTALFGVDDFRRAVTSYTARAKQNWQVAVALADACRTRFGVQIQIGESRAAS